MEICTKCLSQPQFCGCKKQHGSEFARVPCYVVICQDRHSDTTVHPFISKKKAVSEARRMAKEYCQHPDCYKEEEIVGWVFYAEYSCESDHVRVVEAQVDMEI